MDFSEALQNMREGKRVRRPEHAPSYLVMHEFRTPMGRPFTQIVVSDPTDKWPDVEWRPSQCQILATDWEVVEDEHGGPQGSI